ncbi:hypothetical protein Tco_1229364 [Tanacetum coccineum]
MGIPTIPIPVPLNSIRPTLLDNIPFKQFSANLFGSSPFQYTPIPPPINHDKGAGIAKSTIDNALKRIMPFIEEGPLPNLSSLKHFITTEEGPMTHEEAQLQLQEAKRLADFKATKDKSEEKLRRPTLA